MKKQYELQKLNGKGKVYIGVPRERFYMPQFVDNRDMILAELQRLGRTTGYFQADGHRVDRNRDAITKQFLSLPDKPEWLLMLDSDMDHPRNIAERLTAWEKPIVGGLYFHRAETHDPFVFKEVPPMPDEYGRTVKLWSPMRDEVFAFLTKNNVPMLDGALSIDECEGNPLVECDAVATGAMVIHRSVLELMEKPIWEYRALGTSEDMQFCYEAKHDYGIPIFCDISTISGHYVLSPQGQAQFRLLYENRGINLSNYTKEEAAGWVAELLGIPVPLALDKINSGNAAMVGDYWKAKFKGRIPGDHEVDKFYKDSYTGQLYLIELLHWNFTRDFFNIRSLFKGLRGQSVLEIGAGIGTVTMQLAIQNNKVTAAEINPLLREMIDIRAKFTKKEITTELGDITVVADEWKNYPDEIFDTVVSMDTFEHIPLVALKTMLKDIYRVTKKGGHLIYHANFSQQDIYPMHFDHSEVWDSILVESGFIPLSSTHAMKAR